MRVQTFQWQHVAALGARRVKSGLAFQQLFAMALRARCEKAGLIFLQLLASASPLQLALLLLQGLG